MRRTLFILGIFFLLPLSLQAAELHIISPAMVGVGESLEVEVLLSSADEPVNALEVVLELSPNLELQKIDDGSSVVLFWTESPQSKGGSIVFSGIMPGGFNEVGGSVLRLIVKAKAAGAAYVRAVNAKAYRNDGEGTPVTLTVHSFSTEIQQAPTGQGARVEMADYEPPEPFTIELVQDPNMFEGAWFAVFATQDKGSGIARYEVCEGKECADTVSPYVLKNQKPDATIVVKAYDRSGNVRVETLSHPVSWWVYIGALLLVLLVASVIIWRKHS